MAFNRKPSMPPPDGKKPDMVIAVGVPKKPGGSDGGTDDVGGEGKHSVAEAHVIRANQHCKDCQNYDGTSGACSEVQGVFDPDDACVRYFKPAGEEPDADEQGGPPDNDADDAGQMSQ